MGKKQLISIIILCICGGIGALWGEIQNIEKRLVILDDSVASLVQMQRIDTQLYLSKVDFLRQINAIETVLGEMEGLIKHE
jgi:hypothetical protein